MQQQADKWRSVAYASRAMSDTEQHYSQIKKEALAWYRHAKSFQREANTS